MGSVVTITVETEVTVDLGSAGDVEIPVSFDYEIDLNDYEDEVNECVLQDYPCYFSSKLAEEATKNPSVLEAFLDNLDLEDDKIIEILLKRLASPKELEGLL